MEKGALPLPPERGYDLAYQESYRLVSQNLRLVSDLTAVAARTGALLEGEHTLVLVYLGQTVSVRFPEIEVTAVDPALTMRDRLVVLHYLDMAGGAPLTHRLRAFKELPEGGIYQSTFAQRAIKPLLANFGQRPRLLLATAGTYGGLPVKMGDVAVTLHALPRVPLTLVVWQGDEEFPAEGSILFDSSITDYLPTEDITVLCETIAWRLIKRLREAV